MFCLASPLLSWEVDTGGHKAATQGWMGGTAGPHPEPRCSCHSGSVGLNGREGQPGSRPQWGACGRAATQGRPGGSHGRNGNPAPHHTCCRWRRPQRQLCLPVSMVPAGGCVTARQGQQADSPSRPQRTQWSAFVGGLTRPRRRGAWSASFSSHPLPTVGRRSPLHLPREPPAASPLGTSFRGTMRLISEPQEHLRAKKLGWGQLECMRLPPGIGPLRCSWL